MNAKRVTEILDSAFDHANAVESLLLVDVIGQAAARTKLLSIINARKESKC